MQEAHKDNSAEAEDVYADRLRRIKSTFDGLRSSHVREDRGKQYDNFLSLGEITLTILNEISEHMAIRAGIELERHQKEAVKDAPQKRTILGRGR